MVFINFKMTLIRAIHTVIIGTGNVAWHIAESFSANKQIDVRQVFNHRNTARAKRFSKHFQCKLTTDYNSIDTTADLYIIAVKDDAIDEVVKNIIPLKLKGMVVHTSGSMDVLMLNKTSSSIGVYYPLQTFYINAGIDWTTTPLLIEANTKAGLSLLKKVAGSVSKTVKVLDSTNRLQIHLAAVFACNFTNAMYVSAYELIEKEMNKTDTKLLYPIMLQSLQKLKKVHPIQAQTGPAMRSDKTVMNKHLKLLQDNKQLIQIYKLLSDLITEQQASK